jgi:hypothetical protein
MGYISSFFYFHVCNFLGSFTLKRRGSGVWGFFIKKTHFLLLTFLIVCKVFCYFFSLSKASQRGARV